MKKIAAMTFFHLTMLSGTWSLAQESGDPAQLPPPDATAMVGFLVFFVAMIVGYVLWVRRQLGKQRKDETARMEEV